MQTSTDRYRWQPIILFVVILIGLVFFLGLASLILISGLFTLVPALSGGGTNFGTNFIMACGLGFCGLALLPAAYFSLQRVRGKPVRPFQTRPIKVWQGLAMGAGWIGAVLLSDFLYQNVPLGWLAAAPFAFS